MNVRPPMAGAVAKPARGHRDTHTGGAGVRAGLIRHSSYAPHKLLISR